MLRARFVVGFSTSIWKRGEPAWQVPDMNWKSVARTSRLENVVPAGTVKSIPDPDGLPVTSTACGEPPAPGETIAEVPNNEYAASAELTNNRLIAPASPPATASLLM